MNISLYRSAFVALLQSVFAIGIANAEPLRTSDASILWPLKNVPATGPSDPFKIQGDGFCNAPSLDEGIVIPAATFDSFATQVLNKNSENMCARDKELRKAHMFDNDLGLLDPTLDLTRIKGINPEVCQKKHWKIVGFRIDPCMNTAELKSKPDAKCIVEARLVAQPFVKDPRNIWQIEDFTMHLIYQIPDLSVLIKDLKEVSAISKKAETAAPWDSFDGTAGSSVLRPHAGLRAEMGKCGGPVATALRNFLGKHTSPAHLTQIAWMTSSIALTEWTFGVTDVSNNGTSVTQGSFNGGMKFDNFSLSLMSEGQVSLNKNLENASFPNLYKSLKLGAMQSLPAEELTDKSRTQTIDSIQGMLDSTRVSQAQGNCTSCHLATQVLERIRILSGKPTAVGSGEYKVTVWPGFVFKDKSFQNLRNFGYGPGFSLAISRRVVNESDVTQKKLATLFP